MTNQNQTAIDLINYTIENVEIEIDGRSRFTISDINREARKMLRYVRDQLEGTFEQNWGDKNG